MTTTTREKLQKEHFFIRSRTEIVEWLAKEVWTLDENALVAFIETIEKEAEERMKEKCLACVPKIEQSVLDSYDEGNSRDDAYEKWCMMESQVIRNSISSL